MTKQYDDRNRGVLFRNNKKEKDTDCDYSGNCNIEGQEFWINGWIKTPKNGGEKFISFSFKPKNAPKQQQRKASEPEPDFLDESDVPF